MTASDIIRAGQPRSARPWPRYTLSSSAWREMARALPRQPELLFEALWADAEHVYALFTRPDPLLVSAPVEAGIYAALSPARPVASLFERAVGDLWGHIAANAADARPLLDHGFWPVLQPMQARPAPNAGAPEPVESRPPPKGSIELRAGPIARPGPARIAIAAAGERVTQLDARLGYGHRSILLLMRGKTPAEAAPLVARLSGAGTVAHSLAFARAVEAATGIEPPPRALAIRAVVLQLERIAVGLHDCAEAIEAAGQDADLVRERREALLRACHAAFGHRLMMDLVVPGGIAHDMAAGAAQAVASPLEALNLRSFAAHPRLSVLEPRRAELAGLIHALLTRPRELPEGPLIAAVPLTSGEGLGQAEGPRGIHFHWVQVRDGRLAQAFARDPAFLLWPRFETRAVGEMLSDLPVLAAATGLSTAGIDL